MKFCGTNQYSLMNGFLFLLYLRQVLRRSTRWLQHFATIPMGRDYIGINIIIIQCQHQQPTLQVQLSYEQGKPRGGKALFTTSHITFTCLPFLQRIGCSSCFEFTRTSTSADNEAASRASLSSLCHRALLKTHCATLTCRRPHL